jgi:hypothetical protein
MADYRAEALAANAATMREWRKNEHSYTKRPYTKKSHIWQERARVKKKKELAKQQKKEHSDDANMP